MQFKFEYDLIYSVPGEPQNRCLKKLKSFFDTFTKILYRSVLYRISNLQMCI